MYCAAQNGHLQCLQYLREQGCPWDEYIPAIAARNGHLHCLRYLREQGCPWNEYAPDWAVRNGHLHCLRYLREQGCPWNSQAPTNAAQNGHLQCLQYLREQGCPWNEPATEAITRIAEKPLTANELDIYMNLLCDLVNCQVPGYQRILNMPLYIEYTRSP